MQKGVIEMRKVETIEKKHSDGMIRFPYVEIEGKEPGPTFGVVAGVHGSEYIGIEAARRLTDLDPDSIRGTLKVVPVVNVPAFLKKSIAICPVDGAPIGKLFPGDAGGSYTETLVSMVWDLMKDVDYAVDLHGGDMHETLTAYSQWPMTGDKNTDEVSKGMAEAFDMPFIVAKPEPEDDDKTGSYYEAAAYRGIPGILAEVGSHGEVDEELIAYTHYRGLTNVMKYLGMLEGEVERKRTSIPLTNFVAAISPFDGYFYPVVEAGQTVWEDQILGEVIDMFTGERASITAPADAVVLGLVTSLPVEKDQLALGLGTL